VAFEITRTLLEQLNLLARRAGDAILDVYRGVDPQISYKRDDSPLTAADLASHEILAAGLGRLDEGIPVLSEEGASIAYGERHAWERFWCVDPLDGTKEFIKKNGEFTVNIALVDGGEPVLGVVYAPVLDRTYFGARGLGAWRLEGGVEHALSAPGSGGDELAVVASRSHAGDHLTAFLDALPSHRLVSMGSSLKLCLVADGTADLYPRLGPTMEWDTAAAHGVVAAAGGQVLDWAGRPLVYNKENLLNPYFIVLGQRAVPWQQAFAATGLDADNMPVPPPRR
jgi:3'(2'), 5'-bisphosphate nucleotidase